jgi:hypothetical protein
VTERERIALPQEANDLALHVQMCALRHGQVLSSIQDHAEATERRLARIERAAWGIIGLLATAGATVMPQVLPVMRAMAGQ